MKARFGSNLSAPEGAASAILEPSPGHRILSLFLGEAFRVQPVAAATDSLRLDFGREEEADHLARRVGPISIGVRSFWVAARPCVT
jgi:hypothetical protein